MMTIKASSRSWGAAAVAVLVLVAAAARGGAAQQEGAEAGAGGSWEIPDMRQALADAWSTDDGLVHIASAGGEGEGFGGGVTGAAGVTASGPPLTDTQLCGAPAVAAAGCPALLAPGLGWWTGNGDRRNAFLMSVLVRDNYPMVHNLGADGDDTPAKRAVWECLLRQKWRALGADGVEFYESPLNTVAAVRAGSDVFVNMRGTWTQAHRDNNMEWRLGGRKRLWNQGVRYHTGWGKTAEDSYQAIKDIVTRRFNMTSAPGGCTLWLSGHSRGGGAALLTAAFADGRDGRAAPCRVGGVWTFGSVKPYDASFVKAYNTKMGARTYNWWNQIDVVPTLPPGIAGYGAQIPRLRIGFNGSCPAAASTDACIRAGRRNKCPNRRNGAFNHHDYEYTAALGGCAAATLGVTEECVAALAPPYLPPPEKKGKSGSKAKAKAAVKGTHKGAPKAGAKGADKGAAKGAPKAEVKGAEKGAKAGKSKPQSD
ncbi:MAG: hypothetical protein J3K34DRAFT_122834 [Monoraphidium minutum]|nr:MAG: hypothetical protein J3K34DRAFT_122834 [Monoraphidium minutum]